MPFALDVRDADYRRKQPKRVIKVVEMIDCIDHVDSEPWCCTDDELGPHDAAFYAKIDACTAQLRALLRPLVDDPKDEP